MKRLQILVVSIIIMLTGFSFIAWVDWRLMCGAILLTWSGLIQHSLMDDEDDRDPPSNPYLNTDRDYIHRTKP
jgi:hypothetical protein